MRTYVFPGQGSQQKGMGGSLFDEFGELTAKADLILGYSIRKICMEDPDGQLGQTQYTQPALYIVNALCYLKKIKETGKFPDYAAGHSLGEYNALFAAGAFDFETGLKLVKKRGELMGQASGGGMAAVIGLSDEKVEAVLMKNNLDGISIANYNTPTQLIVSGPKADIDRIHAFFEAEQGRYIPLNVSGAFHSRAMEESKRKFEEFITSVAFSPLTIPVVSNIHARPYTQEELKKNLVDQITHSVKWTESIRYLMGLGEMEFEELGPGRVLTGLIQKIRTQAKPLVLARDEERKGQQRSKDMMPVNTGRDIAPENNRKRVQKISAASLGDAEFRNEHNLKYAYVTGSMYKGIASKDMVVKMGKAGMLGFFGTGGLELREVEEAIHFIQKELPNGRAYGMNLLFNPMDPKKEEETVDLFLKYKVTLVEASAYMGINPPLVRYRAHGLKRDSEGKISAQNRIIAKVSRPEVAEAFLSPAPERLVEKLAQENRITPEEAELLKKIPVADDICVEADSGGHTDGGVAYALMPVMIKLRDAMMKKHGYSRKIRVGAAGGIGTPDAAAAAFVLGADFILTGSINQCTVEAGTSDAVKDLLQQINVQDTEYAPAGDMFEMGAKVQVLKKGVFFPARANKLYDLYRQYDSLDEIDEKTRKQIQEKYFKRGFSEIYEEAKAYYPPQEIERADRNPKQKMALVFRWYFGHSTRLARNGVTGQEVDYQVHCGPALGAFNQWVKGTSWEIWKNRHVDEIGEKIMHETAELLQGRFQSMMPL